MRSLNKRTWSVALAVLCFTSVSACTSAPPSTETASQSATLSSEIDSLKSRLAALEQENQQLKKQLEEASSSTAKTPSTAGAAAESEPTVTLGQPFTIPNFAEFTVKKVEFTNRVNPPNPDRYYSYYQVKTEGNIYLDTVVNVKSLLTSGRDADEFAHVTVVYDGRYEYRTFAPVEEPGGGDFDIFSTLEPLKSVVIHFIAEVPKEIATDSKPVKVIISSSGQKFVYTLR